MIKEALRAVRLDENIYRDSTDQGEGVWKPYSRSGLKRMD